MEELEEELVAIYAQHFTAGSVWRRGVCIDAAPIIKWMIGKKVEEVKPYLKKKGWTYYKVDKNKKTPLE